MHNRPVLLVILTFLAFMLISALDTQLIKADTYSVRRNAVASETHICVPFYYQDNDYFCGPAALQMVFNYYGENVSQYEIAAVARSIGEPLYVTYTDELRRAGHFSNISTSMGNELPENITGYTLRSLGYAAFEAFDMNLTTLRDFTDQGKPLILLMWYSSHHVSTHYRVVTGYNETHVFLHDPWNKPSWGGSVGGPNIAFNDSDFLDLWSYYNNWALYVSPWTVNVSAPKYVKLGAPFQIGSTIVYPQPPPSALFAYPASLCNASITLPASLSLAQGETQKKAVDTGFLDAGRNCSLSWMLIADSSAVGTVSIAVEGMISGSVGAHGNYTGYSYSDRIGAGVNFTIRLDVDTSVPVIGKPSRVPETDVQPNREVEVLVNVTDPESGVQNVTLFYTVDNGTTYENRTMDLNYSTNLYETTIPGQQTGALVKFKIFACDGVGNNATLDGTEPYCVYQVVPEFPFFLIPLSLMMATSLVTIVCKKKRPIRSIDFS